MPAEVSPETRFFTESVIREVTRRALKCGAVNLTQGFPDLAALQELKQAAKVAIDQEFNQSQDLTGIDSACLASVPRAVHASRATIVRRHSLIVSDVEDNDGLVGRGSPEGC